MARPSASAEEGRTHAAELLSDPRQRSAVKSVARQALAEVAPEQTEASEALLEPLIDRAARGEAVEPGAGTLRGGFGGTELAVLALVPLTLHAVAHLVRTLGEEWPAEVLKRSEEADEEDGTLFALSLEDAEVVVRASGGSGATPGALELARAVHEAIVAHAKGLTEGSRGEAPRRMTFQDFPVSLRSDGAGQWLARLLPGPAPGRPVPIPPPWRAGALPPVLRDLESLARGSTRNFSRLDEAASNGAPAEALGGPLFDALFTGDLRDAYEYRRASARSRGEGLRIRLVFDPEENLPALVPWELLYDGRSGHFLSLDPLSPVVRQLVAATPTDPRPATTEPPLRVLVASALPEDATPLDAARECRRIEASLASRKDVETRIVQQATVRQLRRAIRELGPHVVHFIGHGGFFGAGREAAALFVDSGGAGDPVSGSDLAAVLRGPAELRLVVLNSCNSGGLSRRQGRDAFSGLAAALVRGGCPAVVAMQRPITDRAAIAFGEGFYQALAAGDPVEVAVTEGRQAVFDLDRRRASFEWATPVLYLGVRSGDLFHLHGSR
ncbi:MAG: CHAT domain-containing protein [Thermoanaerobaculia bacterium]